MLRPQFGGWELVMLPLAAWQLIPRSMLRPCTAMIVGATPGLGGASEDALEAIGQRGNKERCGRPHAGRQCGLNRGAALGASDPGSAGSSSCVSNFSRYMSVRSTFVVLAKISNFNTATPPGPSLGDKLSGSEGETGESMECVLHRRRRAVRARAPRGWAFKTHPSIR